MPNKVQGVKDHNLENYKTKHNLFNEVKGLAKLNKYFTYDPEFIGNPKNCDSIPSTRRSKTKNKKAKLARRANRRNRHA